MFSIKDVTFLIPAYNEEKSIGPLIDRIRMLYPDSEIIVVDNNSTDRTAEIAASRGVRVVFEGRQGKANAMLTGFRSTETEYAIMMDADLTYLLMIQRPSSMSSGRALQMLSSAPG